MIDPLISMALITALLGSGHCLGMCGGLVAALTLSPQGRAGGMPFQLLYHLGRTVTYVLLGTLVGWLGSSVALTDGFGQFARLLLIATDLMIIVLGLGTAGLWSRFNLNRLESASATGWLAAAATRTSRLPAGLAALPLGLVMGFLPCGFLYAMLINAASSASPWRGALVMLAFGVGTAPALLLFGGAAQRLSLKMRSWMLRGAGLMIAVMGCYNLLRHWRMLV